MSVCHGVNIRKLHDLWFLPKHRFMTWIWVQSPEVFFCCFFGPFLSVSRCLNRYKMIDSDKPIFVISKKRRLFYFCRMGSDDSIILWLHDFLYVLGWNMVGNARYALFVKNEIVLFLMGYNKNKFFFFEFWPKNFRDSGVKNGRGKTFWYIYEKLRRILRFFFSKHI